MPFKKKIRKTARSAGKAVEDSEESAGVRAGVRAGVKRKTTGDCSEETKRPKVSRRPKKVLVRKERRHLRRQQKEGYELSVRAKLIWEQLRRHTLETEERSQLLAELVEAITGHVHELAVKHDMARVVQCCLKYGTPQLRTVIFNELRDHIVELSKLKYAKFVVKALLKYCSPSQRPLVISSLYSHVRRLARHTEAAEVLETTYNDFATAHQRASLVQEFYGPQFALPGVSRGQVLADILESSPEQRGAILKSLKETLSPLLNKKVVNHSIVHRALLDFFQNCDNVSRAEMIELMREVVVSILHTKEGSRVALHCLWHGTPKDRKVIIKSFKTYVKKICMEENGHVVMMGVFDCVDDTILVKKALLSEICDSLEELCDHQYGRRLLLYLLSPRNRQHFSPQFVRLLSPGDNNQHSKKPSDLRYRELLEGVKGPLLQLATRRAGLWAQSKPHAPLLVQVATTLAGEDLSGLSVSLVDLLCQNFDSGEGSHLVAHPCAHWVVRKLLEGEGGDCFAELLLDTLPTNQIQAWVGTNRGAFVICSLLRSKLPGVQERVSQMVQPIMSSLRTDPSKGQQALLSELDRASPSGGHLI